MFLPLYGSLTREITIKNLDNFIIKSYLPSNNVNKRTKNKNSVKLFQKFFWITDVQVAIASTEPNLYKLKT